MTFIPLSDKNFVLNKITNSVEIKYKNSDITTHICSESIDSKSLINIDKYNSLSNKEIISKYKNGIFAVDGSSR